MKNVGLYIHFPFCTKRCGYCDFFSSVYDEAVVRRYVDALCSELTLLGEKFHDRIIDTLYFGGGTPSLLTPVQLEKILYTITNAFKCEIIEATIEANPNSAQYLKEYAEMGINRVSIGVQTTTSQCLRAVGRETGNLMEIGKALVLASKHFKNVSVDIMTGLSKDQSILDDLVMANRVTHISAYMLKIEDGTELKRKVDAGEFVPMTDDETAAQFDILQGVLETKGFYRYEVSNFARLGAESKHNMKYWNMEEYLGAGAGAHSYMNGRRFFNVESIERYISGENAGHGQEVLERAADLNAEAEETLMLGLRTVDGVDIESYKKKFGIDLAQKTANLPSLTNGFLKITKNRLRVPSKHFSVLNSILLELL